MAGVTSVWRSAVALLGWPGLLGGAALGWLYLWIRRKLVARLQRRWGPPFYQPAFDFLKLLGKQTVVPAGVNRAHFYALPLAALAAAACALALIPIPANPVPTFNGDLVALLYLLEVPALCEVLAGYVSRSPYGQVSSAREALLSLGYNLPFLAALIALAVHAGSYRVSAMVAAPWSWVRLAATLAFLLAIPARLQSNPFSIPNAEQEILAGARTEYNGAPLALFELAHALELTALVGLSAVLIIPTGGSGLVHGLAFVAASLLVVAAVSVLSAGTARLKLDQAVRFYWSWGMLAALAACLAAALG